MPLAAITRGGRPCDEIGIVDRNRRQRPLVVAGLAAEPPPQRPPRRHFRARQRRDHADERKPRRRRHGFRQANRRAATERDEAVGLGGLQLFADHVERLLGHVRHGRIADADIHVAKEPSDGIRKLLAPLGTKDQHSRHAGAEGFGADFSDGAAAEQHACRRVGIGKPIDHFTSSAISISKVAVASGMVAIG